MIHENSTLNYYNGNNSATSFDFNFKINSNEELKVYHYDKNSTKTLLVENKDYKIYKNSNDDGGYITFPIQNSEYSILNEKEKIMLKLELAANQTTQYVNSQILNLSSLENSLDYLTRLIQINKTNIEKCVQIDETDESDKSQIYKNMFNYYTKMVNLKSELESVINTVSSQITTNNSSQSVLSEKVAQAETSLDNFMNQISDVGNFVSTDMSNYPYIYLKDFYYNSVDNNGNDTVISNKSSIWYIELSNGFLVQGGFKVINIGTDKYWGMDETDVALYQPIIFPKSFSNTRFTFLSNFIAEYNSDSKAEIYTFHPKFFADDWCKRTVVCRPFYKIPTEIQTHVKGVGYNWIAAGF